MKTTKYDLAEYSFESSSYELSVTGQVYFDNKSAAGYINIVNIFDGNNRQ